MTQRHHTSKQERSEKQQQRAGEGVESSVGVLEDLSKRNEFVGGGRGRGVDRSLQPLQPTPVQFLQHDRVPNN